jgi:methylated-DNA-protein-cysteine methyltransferase related protein
MVTYPQIYAVVQRIPEGRVATYGQIARLAGIPRQARRVGYALAALRGRAEADVPWHRVINAQGAISARAVSGAQELQRALLESEGIPFGLDGHVDLARFRWEA